MSSNLPPTIASSKISNNSGQLSPGQVQLPSIVTADGHSQRRSGGSGSFGAGASTRGSASPRNNQTSRKQNKSTKRYKAADEDAIAESVAMRSLNSRKGQTSITHLMNFSLPPRPQSHYRHNFVHGRNNRRNPTWGLGSGYHAVDKARYVHANYRFLVDPRNNYHAQSVDADIHLDWNNVLQILASAQSQEASCPICLGTPIAPRMAKCGHIFCLPCLIRYMHSEEGDKPIPEKKARSKACPICWDSIYISETRPVRWYMGQEGEPPREGWDVVLRLITRSARSTLALPRDGAEMLAEDEDVPWHVAAEVMDYARIMKASENYMIDQFDHDIHELERQEKEDELMFGEDNNEWVRRAVRMINEAKERVKGIGNPPAKAKASGEARPKKPPVNFHESTTGQDGFFIENSSRAIGRLKNTESETLLNAVNELCADTSPSIESETVKNRQNSMSQNLYEHRPHVQSQIQTTEYYFYHALLHYYLSPLDIRILKAAFGSFSSFPTAIITKVEHISTGHVVDDELRKRTKYLGHLPYGCEVGFLECDWTDTIVSDILENFEPELEKRRKRNKEKETQEEKARLRAEKEEDERYASAKRRRASLQSEKFSADDFTPLVSSGVAEGAIGGEDENASTSPPWPARRQGGSFTALASPSTSPSTARTVWGTAAVAPTSPNLQAKPIDVEIPDDGWLQGWEKDLLREDELISQVQAMSLGEGVSPNTVGGKAQKKKKGKKITLMSTNARRGA